MGGCQTGGAGSFAHTNREVFGGTNIQVFEFGVKYLNFGATYLSFGAVYLTFGATYLNFGAIYLDFGAKIKNSVLSNGVGGWGGWVPQKFKRFCHRCREIFFSLPLAHAIIPA